MKAVYRRGYSPDQDLGHVALLKGGFVMNGDQYFLLEDIPHFFTDKFIEEGRLVLLCPENY
jgi:hypothetical protein